MSSASNLEGRSVIVTGAARGLGAAYAQSLAEAGAKLTLLDIGDVSETADTVRSLGGDPAVFKGDITSDDDVKAVVAQAVAKHGKLDGLVNNAALLPKFTDNPFMDAELEEWDRMLKVNVRGTYQMVRAASAPMIEAGYGKIVNISSTTAFFGAPFAHYSGSKGAVISMTYAMARSLGGHNICVNALALDLTESGSIDGNDDGGADEVRNATISGRMLKRAMFPTDVTGAVKFLLGPESDFITAQTLVIDGGLVQH